jgi:hypothetical protein
MVKRTDSNSLLNVCRIDPKVRSKARKPQENHCPLKPEETPEQSALQFIQDGFTSGKYVTQREILSSVEQHCQKTVTYG